MAAYFVKGMLVITALAMLIDNYQWPRAVIAYALLAVPAYGLWEWCEHRKDGADKPRQSH